ncbi:hypothetical protein OXX80_007814 [Metschnikowia pulcherrima]
MKFGKYLASRQLELPEYSGHFIDYKALKKLIKHLGMPAASLDFGTTPCAPTPGQIQEKLKENKASFFFKVERELDKVNSFYLEKQANLAVNLDLLMMKKNELLAKTAQLALQSSDYSSLNFKNSILYLNLYQSFKKIHQDLSRLQQFIELNESGFTKVVKKWDKRSKSHTKELFIQTAVSVQPVFHKNEINELSDLVTSSLFDLESIMDGDYSVLKSVSVLESSSGANLPNRSGSITKLEQDVVSPSAEANGHENGNFRSRQNSLAGFYHSEIDDLYSSFVNVATTKIPDMSVLERWFDKVQSSSKDGSGREKLSKIFSLAIGNLKISDAFLEAFLEHINYDIDFMIDTNDLNTKPIIHECCSIPPASALEDDSHVIINNGVKVVNSNDSISHSREFVVLHILGTTEPRALGDLLASKDFNGRTCLHYAAQNNRQDLLQLLLPHFPVAHIDDLDKDSMSALLLAIRFGNFDIITTLVEFGSNCYPETSEAKLQYLPINYACKFGDYKTLEFLLRSSNPTPEMINRQDVEGLLPLHVIARSGNYKLIKLLIQYGATVNHLDGLNKWPPIFYAASEGYAKTTHELIKFGARLDIVDEDGYNVLYYCVIEGHIDVLNHLLTYKVDFPRAGSEMTENGSVSQGQFSHTSGSAPPSILDEGDDSEDSGETDKNADTIPHLELPPPILPLRRYGHSFLEQKVLIELNFPTDSDYISLFDSGTELKPGRITISSNLSDIVPRNILLPTSDSQRNATNCVFQTDVDSLNGFRIDFEIFPKFGTRLIAKTTALNFSQIDTSSPEINSISLPLFDIRLRNIGELRFNYQIIFPFAGTLLETTKYDTYWKSSASFVKKLPDSGRFNSAGSLSPNNFLSPGSVYANKASSTPGTQKHVDIQTPVTMPNSGTSTSSFVTATSLSGEYLKVKVCLLNDGTPIVCPHWSIAVAENIELYLPNLSLKQLTSMTTSLFDYDKVMADLSKMKLKDIVFVKKLLRIIYLPLETVLGLLDPSINLSIEIVFPSLYELDNIPFAGNLQSNLNKFIDLTLDGVFDHVRAVKQANNGASRSLIFLSSNSIVCKILNWKQPNFPVFLIMNGIVYNKTKKVFEARTANGLLMDEIKSETSIEPNLLASNTSQSKLKYQLIANDQELTVRSIKEATGFIINNNLMGVVTSIHLLNLVPKLIPLIRSRGLVLVASSDLYEPEDEQSSFEELDMYTRTEINGLRFDDVLSFKNDS